MEHAEQAVEGGIQDVEAKLAQYIWGRDQDTLPVVLLRGLEQAGATIAVIEAGSGGALSGLLTSVPSEDPTHPLVHGRVLPLDMTLDRDAASQRATELAGMVRSEAGATVGVAIVVFGAFDERQVLHGMAAVAVTTESTSEVTFAGLRATIEDVHRRSALHAADRLRQLLAAMPAVQA
jgi:nicotinamide mononucleotide (NMN) deamidase PncC